MADFGGWSDFGGASDYGGEKTRGEQYYAILKGLRPPDVYATDDDELCNLVLRADAHAMGDHGQLLADRLLLEIFPQTAEETLPDWEELLGIVPDLGADALTRQAAVRAKWFAGLSSSLADIRRILYPLLNPTTAFADDFFDAFVSSRYEGQDGNGARSEGAGFIDIQAVGSAACDWESASPNAAQLLMPLVDRVDDFSVEAKVNSYTLGADTAGGLVVYEDDENAYMVVVGDTGSGAKLRVDKIIGGTITEDVDALAITAPTAPFELFVDRIGQTLKVSYAAPAGAAPTVLGTVSMEDERAPRKWGAFCRNDATSQNAATATLSQWQIAYANAENNVEIIEETKANADASGDAANIFFFFVHRRSSDPGSYDIERAQRLLDRIKQGHVLALVGERAEFRCDDPESLCNRDILR